MCLSDFILGNVIVVEGVLKGLIVEVRRKNDRIMMLMQPKWSFG